jgi:cation transport ATPase
VRTGTLTEGRLVVEDVQELATGRHCAAALGALAASDPHPNATLQAIKQRFADADGWRADGAVPFSSARK